MKIGEVKAGELVVVSEVPDATVYIVDKVIGHVAWLSVASADEAKRRYVGTFDVCYLSRPTEQQLAR